ncbi:MAG: CBM35 domain-containing protein [Patescibacteria group bacterium]|nr:CBM35 domain-containing protein [Patescibacteria group bacterium]
MKAKLMVMLVSLMLVGVCRSVSAAVTLDVPYIHQVQDMNQGDFLGYNACAPTSAVMITSYYGLQPDNPSSYKGWYVYNAYSGCTDVSGEDYTTSWARDWNPSNDTNPHVVYGAHGYIVKPIDGDWKADASASVEYLQRHGLTTGSAWIYSSLMSTIKSEIDAGRPLIGHLASTYGHYLVIIGYTDDYRIVVNDPFGNINTTWNGTTSGQGVIYTPSSVGLDRVLTISPIICGRYPVDTALRQAWANGGGESSYGFAVTPLYSDGSGWRQDFRHAVMYLTANNSIIISGWSNSVCPGETVNGWRPDLSPVIVSCFNDNGKASLVGEPVSDNASPVAAHQWGSCWIQNFSGDSLNGCAIVYDSQHSQSKAFVIHGQLWDFYRAYGGPNIQMSSGTLGGPVEEEKYATDDYNGHQLAVQKMANGYLVYDTVYGYSDVRGTLSAGFHYATIPGNGTSLNLYANETSSTTVYLSGSAVTGTSYYRVYQDNQYLGTLNPATLDFTVSNLAPSSSHSYHLEAVDGNANVLATSSTVTVTLPVAPALQNLQVVLQPRTLSLDASWLTIAGAAYYRVSVNGSFYNNFQNAQCTIYNLSNGQTVTVHVSAYSATGVVLAAGSAALTLGQNVSIVTYDSPVVLLPNQTYTRTYYIFNNTADPITDFVGSHSGIAVNSSWATLDSNTYQLPSYIAPYSTVFLCTVTFHTGSDYLLSSSVAVSVWFEADGDMPSLGLLGINRSFQDYLQVVRFTDPASDLPATMNVDASAVPLTLSNEANSTCASFRYEVYLDDTLVASLLAPQLAVREVWETTLDFSSIPSGQYDLRLVVNTDNAVQNVRTDNDVSHCLLTLNNPTLMYHQRSEAEAATLTNVAVDTDHAGFSGIGFVDEFESFGDVVSFTVNVPLAGTYRFDFGYANGYPDAAVRHIWIDGEYFSSLVFPSLGTWDDWSTASQLGSLTAGVHTIELSSEWSDSGAINLDYLEVTQLPNWWQRLEAETASLTNTAVDTDHVDYVGSGFVDQYESVGDAVDFAVTVPMNATYRLRFRYSRGDPSPATRNVYLDCDYFSRQTFLGLGSSWDVWGNSEVLVNLTAGAHTIGLVQDWMNGGAINLDALEVTEVATPIEHLEAEAATLTGLGINTGHWGYSGTGFADGFDSPNRGADFTLAIPEAGQYQLVFRYANGTSDDATRNIYVDGQLVDTLTLPSLGPDQWDVWGEASLVVNLTAGAHEIGSWYEWGNQTPINLDYLEVRNYPALP